MEFKLQPLEAMITIDILKWFIENGPEDVKGSFINTKNLGRNVIHTLELQIPPENK